jgi:gliding motility-associated-like protein
MKSQIFKSLVIILLVLKAIHVQAQAVSDTVCASLKAQVYRVHPTEGSRYFWKIDCGTIISQQGLDSIMVDWCNQPGIYTIRVVEVNDHGCIGDTVAARVMVNDQLRVIIAGAHDICEGESIQLHAQGAWNFIWSNGYKGATLNISPKKTTTYSVIGYGGKCKNDTAAFTVNVHKRPKAQFTYKPQEPNIDESVFFNFTGSADTWEWHFGDKDTLGGSIPDPQHTFNEPGDKTVTLIARNYSGCTDMISYRLHVKAEMHIFVPNAFTPNDDRVNDVFKAVTFGVQSLHVEIYNRWGEIIYTSDDLDGSWDGTFHGQPVQDGVYLYMIKAQGVSKEWQYLKGNVTLSR